MILTLSWVWVPFRLGRTAEGTSFPYKVFPYLNIKIANDIRDPHWFGRKSVDRASLDLLKGNVLGASCMSQPSIHSLPDLTLARDTEYLYSLHSVLTARSKPRLVAHWDVTAPQASGVRSECDPKSQYLVGLGGAQILMGPLGFRNLPSHQPFLDTCVQPRD